MSVLGGAMSGFAARGTRSSTLFQAEEQGGKAEADDDVVQRRMGKQQRSGQDARGDEGA